jgi:NAD(P)-dependent dehydrogenase (short-subunit alcohol dehydrogenase family)
MNILVTGASRGIGASIARTLQARGHAVVGTSRTADADAEIPLVAMDIGDPASVEAALAAASHRLGRVDALVNNVGYDLIGALGDTSWEAFLAQIDTNFLGTVRVIQAALPEMRARRAGRIVTISSLGGQTALPYNAAYAASKFTLEGLSESLRFELRPYGIHVSLIVPGYVRTETLATSVQTVPGPSHYGIDADQIAARARQQGSRSPVTPAHVAAAVARAIESPRPRLRYIVGAQAHQVTLLKRFLPEWAYEAVVARLFVEPVWKDGRAA